MRRLILAVAVAAAVVVAGCGEKSEGGKPGVDQLTLALDFYVNADHAGIYEALDQGYFADAGLDVKPVVPSDPAAPIREVAAGRVDLAISYEPEVLLARDQGLPVKAVAALVPTPLTSLISTRKAGIRKVSDLAGKTVATAGIPYQQAYLDTILSRAGLTSSDLHVVNVQQGLLPAVISGKADAMLGGFLNVEGVDLRLRGEDPRVVPVDRLGIPTYDELVLVASTDELNSNPRPIQLFIAALERGTKAAAADPAEATHSILDAGQGLDPRFTRAEVHRTLPLLSQRGTGKPFGYMDPRRWLAFARFFANNRVIQTVPKISDAETNDLLPGKAHF
jgi:putative hydroxymethylpyrimidine transport system substrate-binding protein